MYSIFLISHSYFRWVVLFSLVFTIYRGYKGWLNNEIFSGFDNTLRHMTATATHLQLMLGYILYLQSPITDHFTSNFKSLIHQHSDFRFFGFIHPIMMFSSITIITIGSMITKRKINDKDKFKTMSIWFSIGLIMILCSIPWMFSPLAQRPYLR